jgi:ABC-type antimicrobial peptide transport system permease subunit
LVAKGAMPGRVLLARMSEVVRSVDRSQAVYNVRTLDEVLGSLVSRRRTNALLIGAFAGLALVLSAVGVYAVVSYGIGQRARELGIRSALGATGQELMRMISREMVWVTIVGLSIGLGSAWVLAKTLDSMVYGVGVHDPLTFMTVPFALVLPVILATLFPARRVLRVDPAQVMRAE